MSDYFIQRFYNDVKDPSWPIISGYWDFRSLPDCVQQECESTHGFWNRIKQIESPTYWQDLLGNGTVWTHGKLAYVAVPKCASSYYINVFQNLGWQQNNLQDLPSNTVCFTVLLEPTQRYLKGLTEWLYHNILPIFHDAESIPLSILQTLLIPDLHSLPYSTTLGPWLDRINCIPMCGKTDGEIASHIMKLCEVAGQPTTIPTNITRIHQSSSRQLQLFQQVKHHYDTHDSTDRARLARNEYLHILLSQDLAFYRQLLETFDPVWQNIKTI